MKAFCIYCLLVSTVGRSGHAASGHANSRACSLVSKKNLVCGGSGAASRSTKLCAMGSIPWWLIWKERNASLRRTPRRSRCNCSKPSMTRGCNGLLLVSLPCVTYSFASRRACPLACSLVRSFVLLRLFIVWFCLLWFFFYLGLSLCSIATM
jgi:hypothetical protein